MTTPKQGKTTGTRAQRRSIGTVIGGVGGTAYVGADTVPMTCRSCKAKN